MNIFNFLLGILPGSVTCFFGLKLRRIVLVISWFILGYYGLAFFIEHIDMSDTLKLVLQLLAGVVFAILSLRIQKVAWFLLVFAIGFLVVFMLMPDVWYSIVLAIIIGLIFGIIAFYMYEPMIVISTALGGSYSIALSISDYFGLSKLAYLLLIFALLAIAGLYVQFSCLKKEKLKKSETKVTA